MDKVQIGKKIKLLRLQKGWTQYNLAMESGLSPTYISDLEKCEKCPTVETLDNICFALGITLGEFFNEKSELLDKISALTVKQRKLLNDFLESLWETYSPFERQSQHIG